MIFYTKPDCHLCADALPNVRKVARLFRRDVSIVDIESSDELVVQYGLRIPVLTTDSGDVLAEGSFGAVQIIKALLGYRPG
jgi:ABC-type uncharacterized transport system ATPase subunit